MKELVAHLDDKLGAGQFFVGEVCIHELTSHLVAKEWNRDACGIREPYQCSRPSPG